MMKCIVNVLVICGYALLASATENEAKINDVTATTAAPRATHAPFPSVSRATHPPYPGSGSSATHPPYPGSGSRATHPPFPIVSRATHAPYPSAQTSKKNGVKENPLKSFPVFTLTQTLRKWLTERLSLLSPTMFVPLGNRVSSIKKKSAISTTAQTAAKFWTRVFQSLKNSLWMARRFERLPSKPKFTANLVSLINKLKPKLLKKGTKND